VGLNFTTKNILFIDVSNASATILFSFLSDDFLRSEVKNIDFIEDLGRSLSILLISENFFKFVLFLSLAFGSKPCRYNLGYYLNHFFWWIVVTHQAVCPLSCDHHEIARLSAAADLGMLKDARILVLS
jgi:hypothetical protein